MFFSKKDFFENSSIKTVILKMTVPAIFSQISLVLFNLMDTYFLGKLNNINVMSALTVALPIFIFLNGLSNMFAIGGSSYISRNLGYHKLENVTKCFLFCILCITFLSILIGITLILINKKVLYMFGAIFSDVNYCYSYLFWTIGLGCIPICLNPFLSSILRAVGWPRQAGFGMAFIFVLNIVLDPLLIYYFDLGINGAALATTIASAIGFVYFISIIVGKIKFLYSSTHIKNCITKDIVKEVFGVGLPSLLLNTLGCISNIVSNVLLSSYSQIAVTGIGIARRINVLTFALAHGFADALLPVIGYNFALKNFPRMKNAYWYSVKYGLYCSVSAMVLLLCFGRNLINLFTSDPSALMFASKVLYIFSISAPLILISLLELAVFQAVGWKIKLIVVSMIRKGGVDIPLMLLFNHLFGLMGVFWAFPVSDVIVTLLNGLILHRSMKKIT